MKYHLTPIRSGYHTVAQLLYDAGGASGGLVMHMPHVTPDTPNQDKDATPAPAQPGPRSPRFLSWFPSPVRPGPSFPCFPPSKLGYKRRHLQTKESDIVPFRAFLAVLNERNFIFVPFLARILSP